MASKTNCDDVIENRTVGDKIVEEANKRATNNRRYNYKRVLGKGGFGHVLMAVDHVRREVAIKHVEYKVVDKSTAKREVDILVELQHENIVAIRDYFQIRNKIGMAKGMAIVMELCPSGSLYKYLSELKNVPLSIENRLSWYKQLASAIQFIHVRKIAHRDLKPANILVADHGKILKVADVGIAKVLGSNDDTFTEEYMKTHVGTPWYMAPEVHNQHYTLVSDIFSLGLVMYVICELPVDLNPVVIHREKEYALGEAYHRQLLNKNATSLLVVKYATEDERKLFDHMLHRKYQQRITASDVDNELKSIEDRRERERRERERERREQERERERREQERKEEEQKRQQQDQRSCWFL